MGAEADNCNLSGYIQVYINGRTGGITILSGKSRNTALINFIKTLFLQWEYMSLKHNILHALGLYQMSTLKNFFKIVLGSHSSYGRALRHDSGGIHLRPVCFDTGKGHPQAFYARQPLHRINAWHRTKELLHRLFTCSPVARRTFFKNFAASRIKMEGIIY